MGNSGAGISEARFAGIGRASQAAGGGRLADPAIGDIRFSALLGSKAWTALPTTVRARFGKRVAAGAVAAYAGTVTRSQRTFGGWCLAQAARMIGAPLPLHDHLGAPALVTVSEDPTTGGQFWTRMYGRARGFPQVIISRKQFAGPTGLEEHLGLCFGIALTVSADARALHFNSDHYFLAVSERRWRLPRWLSPGRLTISHIDHGDGRFAFVLELRHPLVGELISQTVEFGDAPSSTAKVFDHV